MGARAGHRRRVSRRRIRAARGRNVQPNRAADAPRDGRRPLALDHARRRNQLLWAFARCAHRRSGKSAARLQMDARDDVRSARKRHVLRVQARRPQRRLDVEHLRSDPLRVAAGELLPQTGPLRKPYAARHARSRVRGLDGARMVLRGRLRLRRAHDESSAGSRAVGVAARSFLNVPLGLRDPHLSVVRAHLDVSRDARTAQCCREAREGGRARLRREPDGNVLDERARRGLRLGRDGHDDDCVHTHALPRLHACRYIG